MNRITRHARVRMRERGIAWTDLMDAVESGRQGRAQGGRIIKRIRRLAVVLSLDGYVLTVIPHRDPK